MFPKRFIPIFIENNELVRLGSVDDGGYLVPKQTVESWRPKKDRDRLCFARSNITKGIKAIYRKKTN